MSSIFQFINIAEICNNYILHKKLNKNLEEPFRPFVSFLNLKLLSFTWSHSFSFVVTRFTPHCHSLSFVVMSFVVTCCHSLSLLYHSALFVVTRCTTHILIIRKPLKSVNCFSQKPPS